MRLLLPLAAMTLALVAGCDRGPDTDAREPSTSPRAVTESRQAAATPAPATTGAPGTLAPASPPRDTLSDTVITGKIKAAILTDPGMTGADVSVNTDKGVVSLAGSVKSQEQIAIASAHAQRQDGVMRVDNHLAMNAQ
jgi:osmotically-inducible protein OsmY